MIAIQAEMNYSSSSLIKYVKLLSTQGTKVLLKNPHLSLCVQARQYSRLYRGEVNTFVLLYNSYKACD